MTREEQFKAIIERLGPSAANFQPFHLSVLVLIDYMDVLFQHGLLTTKPIDIEAPGKNALAVCYEMDWKPSDGEMASFCKELVEPFQANAVLMSLIALRDDKENFLKNAKKHIDLTGF